MTDEDIELAADWSGEDGGLVSALVGVGFLDGAEGQRKIHDWAEHQPWSAGAEDRKQSSAFAALCKRYGREGAAKRMPEYAARMRPAREPHATRTEAASDTQPTRVRNACETDAPLPSPSPSPKEEKPPLSADASVESAPDLIWADGLAWLKAKGVSESKARSTLGLVVKEVGKLGAAELLGIAEAEDVVNPVAWLLKAASTRKAGNVVPIAKAKPPPPEHNPDTHRCHWNGASWVLEVIPMSQRPFRG